MSTSYQVKLRGQIVGQATLEVLQRQAATGQITPLHKLCGDDGVWRYAGDFPELFPASTTDSAAASPPTTTPAQPAAEPQWYVSSGDEPLGPYTLRQVIDLIAAGNVSLAEKVWQEGTPDWLPIPTAFPRESAWVEERLAKTERRRQKAAAKEAKREEIRRRHAAIPPEEKSYSMLAIASVVFSAFWIFGAGSLMGVILGGIAAYDIVESDGRRRGMRSAVVGIALGAFGLFVSLVVLGSRL